MFKEIISAQRLNTKKPNIVFLCEENTTNN